MWPFYLVCISISLSLSLSLSLLFYIFIACSISHSFFFYVLVLSLFASASYIRPSEMLIGAVKRMLLNTFTYLDSILPLSLGSLTSEQIVFVQVGAGCYGYV